MVPLRTTVSGGRNWAQNVLLSRVNASPEGVGNCLWGSTSFFLFATYYMNGKPGLHVLPILHVSTVGSKVKVTIISRERPGSLTKRNLGTSTSAKGT